MKKLSIAILILITFGVVGTGVTAPAGWVSGGDYGGGLASREVTGASYGWGAWVFYFLEMKVTPDDTIILEFGGTKLRIHKCGKVEIWKEVKKHDWKEIVPNPDTGYDETDDTYIIIDDGSLEHHEGTSSNSFGVR